MSEGKDDMDKNVGKHAQIGRADLEQHMRKAHGIVAETRATPETVRDGNPVGQEVIELDAIGEARLRASHWRAHELGIEHRNA